MKTIFQKKQCRLFILASVLFVQFAGAQTPVQLKLISDTLPKVEGISGKAYLLLEPSTRTILAGNNIHERLVPASLTKVMTAYVVFNAIKSGKISLETTTTVSKLARGQGGSRTYLELGDVVSVDTLLSGMLAHSGNDSAVALAELVGGSVPQFVQLMNETSKALGMNDTLWHNPNGLPQDEHFTSAYDFGILASSIINEYPQYYHYFGIKWFKYNGVNQKNRDRLLFNESINVDGMKTGWTVKAGYCVINSMEKDGMRLVSVVLGAPNPQIRFNDSLALFNYGNDTYEISPYLGDLTQPLKTINVFGANLKSVQLYTQHAPKILVKKDNKPKMSFHITAPDFELGKQLLPANSQYGRIRYYENDQLISDEALYIKQALEPLTWWELTKETFKRAF